MLGYLCHACESLICIAKSGERRDCPHCGCPAQYTANQPTPFTQRKNA